MRIKNKKVGGKLFKNLNLIQLSMNGQEITFIITLCQLVD